MKLNLACGHDYRENYINIDIDINTKVDLFLDYTHIRDKFKEEIIEEIIIIHAICYLSPLQAMCFFGDCYSLLISGGKLIIECPDLDKMIKMYMETDNPGVKKEMTRCIMGFDLNEDNIDGNFLHAKWAWTEKTLAETLTKIGFSVTIETPTMHNKERDLRVVAIK
jgi:predicted SAM-dependent methyltransferase